MSSKPNKSTPPADADRAGGRMPSPGPSERRWRIDGADGAVLALHGDLVRLASHLAKHVLHPSARCAFVAAHPWLGEIDVFASDAAANRLLSHRAQDPSFEAVATAYARVVQHSLSEATALGWTVRVDRLSSVHLDSAGILVVIGGASVRTAFFPGIDRVENEFRQRRESRNERAAREARERRWDADERFYYRTFRPAIKRIRAFTSSGVRGDAQYGALKRVLPKLSDLALADWRSMRARLGHLPMA